MMGKETDDCESEAENTMLLQQNSPKRNKKIKVDRDPQTPRETTRSKTRIKTPQVLNRRIMNRPYQ